MKKKGIMQLLQYGIWWFMHYNKKELACKLKKNSYISCETVLKEAGIIFQYYGATITCISDNTLSKTVDGTLYLYKKIHDRIRLDPIGIEQQTTYAIASPERAICDMLYLNSQATFDDLSSIDRKNIQRIATIYPPHVLSCIDILSHDR